jgi:hypothetical protein
LIDIFISHLWSWRFYFFSFNYFIDFLFFIFIIFIIFFETSIYYYFFFSLSHSLDVKYGFELKNKDPSSSGLQSTERTPQHQASVLISCENLDIKREWLKDIKVLVKDHQVAEAKRRALAQGRF